MRQLHRSLLRKPFWRNQIATTFGSNPKNMERMFNEQHKNKGGLHSNNVQPSGCPVSATIGSPTGMESQQVNIFSTGATVGSTFRRSICDTVEHQMPPVCNVEVRRSGDCNRCDEADLDSVQQPLYLPTLEHDTQYRAETAIRSGKELHVDNTQLDQRNMVPSSVTADSTPRSGNNPTGTRHGSTRAITVAFGEESALAVDGLAFSSLDINKQRRIDLPSTLNDESSAIIYDPTRLKL